MTKEYLIHPVGTVSYETFDKPVKYSADFLANLTSNQNYPVHEGHEGNLITETESVFFKNDGLYATLKDDIDTKNKGFSIHFDPLKVEEFKDYFYPLNDGFTVRGVDIVNFPKNKETMVYNGELNIEEKKESDKMSENNSEKDRKIGSLENQVNAKIQVEKSLKEALQNKEQEIINLKKQVDELNNKNEDISTKFSEDISALNEKISVYQQKENEEKESLLKEIAGEDEKSLSVYSKLGLNDLKLIKENQIKEKSQNNVGKGVNASMMNQMNQKPEEKELKDFTGNEFAKLSKELNIRI